MSTSVSLTFFIHAQSTLPVGLLVDPAITLPIEGRWTNARGSTTTRITSVTHNQLELELEMERTLEVQPNDFVVTQGLTPLDNIMADLASGAGVVLAPVPPAIIWSPQGEAFVELQRIAGKLAVRGRVPQLASTAWDGEPNKLFTSITVAAGRQQVSVSQSTVFLQREGVSAPHLPGRERHRESLGR